MGGPLDRWYEVAFGTHTGWVHGAYLERAADESDDPCTGYDLMLPWTAGESHPVARGHGTSPHRYDAEHAWDFSLPVGTVVRAAHSGVVRRANLGSLGSGCDERSVSDPSYVVVSRGDGSETLYLHLASIDVTEGQRVSRGQRIGASGRPGAGCEAYVHFQLQSTPSPSSSGSWWEPSVPASFHDGGSPYDPAEGSTPISANEPT
jgi:murein DD-endopeptidase MepM/ murein hydrolase activator NlpD